VDWRTSPLTWLLLAAIGAVFALELATGATQDPRVLVRLGALVPVLVWSGDWWRLLTAMFLHGGWLHIALNGWALYQLGGIFEAWMGSSRMALTYFASGLAGSVASLFFLRGDLSVGASGAIFGVLGALVGVLLRRRDRLQPQAKALLTQLLTWAGINVFLGFSTPNIDNAAHLGGAAAGLVLGLVLRPTAERQPLIG
jgi:rhomboid protease GluP